MGHQLSQVRRRVMASGRPLVTAEAQQSLHLHPASAEQFFPFSSSDLSFKCKIGSTALFQIRLANPLWAEPSFLAAVFGC